MRTDVILMDNSNRIFKIIRLFGLMCIAAALILTTYSTAAVTAKVSLTYLRQFHLGFSFTSDDDEPIWIAAGSAKAGIIVAYDSDAYKMRIYNLTGKQLRSFGAVGMLPGQFTYPTGLAIDDAGGIYVADRKIPVIRKYDQYGKLLTEFMPVQGVLGWSDVTVRNNTIVAAVDSFSAFHNKKGIYLYQIDTKKSRQLCRSCYGPVAIGESGNITSVIYDAEGNATLTTITSSAKISAQYQFSKPWFIPDITFSKKMNGILVANAGLKTVELYDEKAQLLGTLYKPDNKKLIPIAAIPIGDELYIVHIYGEVFVYKINVTS